MDLPPGTAQELAKEDRVGAVRLDQQSFHSAGRIEERREMDEGDY